MQNLPAPPETLDLAFQAIQRVTLEHLADVVVYRVRVGRILVEQLYGGDFDAIHDRSRAQESSFRAFYRRHRVVLMDWNLGDSVLRRCLAAAEVARGVPEDLLRKIDFTHLWHLRRVGDPAWRAALIKLTAENQWSVAELRQVIAQADAGAELTDADAERAGLQPLVPPEPASPVPPPRPLRGVSVVRRFKQTAGAVDALVASVTTPGSKPLSNDQADQAWRTVDHIEARLSLLKARLPARD